MLAIDLFLNSSRILETLAINYGVVVPYLGSAIHVLALVAALALGGAFRLAASKQGIYLLCLTAWMLACVPTSSWRGGSVDAILHSWLPSVAGFFACGAILTLGQSLSLIHI